MHIVTYKMYLLTAWTAAQLLRNVVITNLISVNSDQAVIRQT